MKHPGELLPLQVIIYLEVQLIKVIVKILKPLIN